MLDDERLTIVCYKNIVMPSWNQEFKNYFVVFKPALEAVWDGGFLSGGSRVPLRNYFAKNIIMFSRDFGNSVTHEVNKKRRITTSYRPVGVSTQSFWLMKWTFTVF